MNKYEFDVNISGKVTFEVYADSREDAERMVNEVLETSTFKELKERDKSIIDVEMKQKKPKDLER